MAEQERVVIEIADNPNKVIIRARMNYGVKQRVAGASNRYVPGEEFGYDLGKRNIALLVHNIVGVSGPAFEGVTLPLTESVIYDLPTDVDPLLEKALAEINDRNRPNPNSQAPTPTTSVG